MKNVRFIIISLSLIVGTVSVNAQRKYTERQLDKRIDRYSFEVAVSGYEALVNRKKHKGPETYIKIANLYYMRSLYQKAAVWFEKAANENPKILSKRDMYRLGHSLKSAGRYDESDIWMERYNLFAENKIPTNVKEKVVHLDSLKLAKLTKTGSDILYPGGYIPNTNEVLVTRFSKSAGYGQDTEFTGIYTFKVEDSITDQNFEILEGNFDTQFNVNDAIMTKDGSTLYFSRNVIETKKKHRKEKKTNQYQIYQSKRENTSWGAVEPLVFNVEGYSTGHPALTPDEDWLYFTSDRPGGQGESDLYRVSRSETGTFGAPENLGTTINTPFEEGFPFVTKDTLYFSSKAHTNLGGADIFYSVVSEDGFSEPVNMGTPINSHADDFAFLLHNSSKQGLLASNRVGESDEIFLFEGSVKHEPKAQDCQDLVLHGQVIDFVTRQPIPYATVKTHLYNEKTQEIQTDEYGKFMLSNLPCAPKVFEVSAQSDGYQPFIATPVFANMEGELYLPLEKGEANKFAEKQISLEPIYFDLNSSYLRPDSKEKLDKVVRIMNENPTLEIAIQSHTDAQASDHYNQWLSGRRAMRTYEYLVKKGISPSRLSRQGYGEARLTNDCYNDVHCPDDIHEQNRRSEFIIINR